MPTLKLLTWNMEWMNDLFTSHHNFKDDNVNPFHMGSATVLQRRQHLAGVINEIKPEVVVVIEGPNHVDELKLFFDTDVDGSWTTHVQKTSGSSQCIGCAVRDDVGAIDTSNPMEVIDSRKIKAFKTFDMDTEDDGIVEKYKFERYPVYVQINLSNGRKFRVLGLHLKSKGIFQSLEWGRYWNTAMANRRKLLAKATQIRQEFLNNYLTEDGTKDIPLIVCGDINDGPGFDALERKLLGSAVERLMGNVWHPMLTLGNALFDTLAVKYQKSMDFTKISTTRFRDPIFNNSYHKPWIDHIMYSRNIGEWVNNGTVHEDFGDEKIWKKYKYASDHQPITVDIELN